MPLSNISKCLVSPSRLASSLNWRNVYGSTVMALDISHELIGWAVTKFPPLEDADIQTLDSIPYIQSKGLCKSTAHTHHKYVQDTVLATISSVIKEEGVKGFLVGWPLQPNARPGIECGRTLHLLDHFADQVNYPIINKNRPVALWDKRPFTHNRFEEQMSPEDGWRRSVLYTRTPSTCSREKHLIQNGVYSSRCHIHPCTSTPAQCATMLLQQFTQTYYSKVTTIEQEFDPIPPTKKQRAFLKDERTIVESFDSGSYAQSLLI